MERIKSLQELKRAWIAEAYKTMDRQERDFCFRMSDAQQEAIDARRAGPAAVDALLEKRAREAALTMG